jgi:hypothetical protein
VLELIVDSTIAYRCRYFFVTMSSVSSYSRPYYLYRAGFEFAKPVYKLFGRGYGSISFEVFEGNEKNKVEISKNRESSAESDLHILNLVGTLFYLLTMSTMGYCIYHGFTRVPVVPLVIDSIRILATVLE